MEITLGIYKMIHRTLGFHSDCGLVVLPIHRNAVNTARHIRACGGVTSKKHS